MNVFVYLKSQTGVSSNSLFVKVQWETLVHKGPLVPLANWEIKAFEDNQALWVPKVMYLFSYHETRLLL